MWGKPAGLGAAFLIYTTVNYCLCFQNVVILLDRVPVTLQRREREKFLVDEFLMIYLPPEHHATACLAQGLCSPRRTTEDMSDLQLVCCDHLSPGPRSMETNGGQPPAPGSRQAGTSRTGLGKRLFLSIQGSGHTGHQHYSALQVSRGGLLCGAEHQLLLFSLQSKMGILAPSLPWATTWSCLEKLQQKDLSRGLCMLIFEMSAAHVLQKTHWIGAPEHLVLYK